ncbi:hypothetical protein TNIN_345871 [Trichonephila inaurata madagascariensis]|uniref:Uncharacterized protein n=1 Tax=Trichonephila inaurata madagascariensis TaxID=2747483 RepID=A0A8X7CPM6_9ARAC|nr:hypothetical protein TNIN_345871 [Trichonephila inaurata madagascariensis]
MDQPSPTIWEKRTTPSVHNPEMKIPPPPRKQIIPSGRLFLLLSYSTPTFSCRTEHRDGGRDGMGRMMRADALAPSPTRSCIRTVGLKEERMDVSACRLFEIRNRRRIYLSRFSSRLLTALCLCLRNMFLCVHYYIIGP